MITTTIATLALGLSMATPQQGFGGPPQGGPGGPPPMMGGPRQGPMMGNLILNPDVVKELKLTDEQVEKLKRLMPPGRGPGGPGGPGFGGPGAGGPPPGGGQGGPGGPGGPQRGQGGFGPPPGQGGQGGPPGGFGQGGPGGPPQGGFGQGGQRGPGGPGGPGQGPNMDREIQKILNVDQFKRWKQIELQVQAPASIMRPDVVEKLGLTEDQMERIHEIHQDMRPPRPPQDGERPSREEMEKMRQQMQGQRDELLKKVLGVLTSEQREKWNALTGKAFKLNPPQPRRED